MNSDLFTHIMNVLHKIQLKYVDTSCVFRFSIFADYSGYFGYNSQDGTEYEEDWHDLPELELVLRKYEVPDTESK